MIPLGNIGKYLILYSPDSKKVVRKSDASILYAPILTGVDSLEIALEHMRKKEGFEELHEPNQ